MRESGAARTRCHGPWDPARRGQIRPGVCFEPWWTSWGEAIDKAVRDYLNAQERCKGDARDRWGVPHRRAQRVADVPLNPGPDRRAAVSTGSRSSWRTAWPASRRTWTARCCRPHAPPTRSSPRCRRPARARRSPLRWCWSIRGRCARRGSCRARPAAATSSACTRRPAGAALRLAEPAGSVTLVDFREQRIGASRPADQMAYAIDYAPYQVVSILVRAP